MMWMENHAVDDPKETDHMSNVFLPCEGKVLGMDSNERPVAYYIAFYCLLYCILLSTGFTVRKLYYVSILFYYASVFDFPKYKKLYIALCYGRKYFLPRSIRNSLQKQTNLASNWCSLSFPLFSYTCEGAKPNNSLQMARASA